ncbi:MAG: shikimate dehydrogenase [Acidaminococcaceae bacterium]|nr:shikimate dehydrogenase [Acidaminococcaceae bacterium]
MKFGLLGAKLGHSLSPQIHQEVFRRLSITATYELIEVPGEKLAATVEELRKSYRGLNVTIPHKVAVMDSLDRIAPEAEAIGAVNTISFAGGKAEGFNTDYFGFARLLEHEDLVPTGKNVCVLGTGGASRAILQCVRNMGAGQITVISRKTENAPEDIRSQYKVRTYEELRRLEGDLLVNCTPVGMYPAVDASPVDKAVMEHFGAAVDIIYNPAETRFMQLAKAQGKKAVNGLFMLVAQAVAADEIWLERKLDDALIADVTEKMRSLL